MALTDQQIQMARQQYGLNPAAGTGAPSTSVSGLNTNPRMNLIFGAPKTAPTPAPGTSDFYKSPEAVDAAAKKGPLASDLAVGAEKTAANFVESSDVLGTMNRMAKGDTADLNANKIPNLIDAANPLKKMHELAGDKTNWTGVDTDVKPSENKDFSGTSPAERAQLEQPSNFSQQVGSTAAIVAANAAPFVGEAMPMIKGVAGKVTGAAVGTAGKAASATADMAKSAAKAPLNALRGYADSKVRNSIKSDVQSTLKSTGAVSRRASEITEKGNDIQKTFSDPAVFNGLKVENGRVNPDGAIEVLDNRIEPLVDTLNKKVLPAMKDLGVTISLGDLWQRAKDYLEKNPGLEGDKQASIQRMQDQLSHYVEKAAKGGSETDSLPIDEADKIRADARASARDAKGTMKSDSEYAAIETAARDAVFDAMDKHSDSPDFKVIRNYIKQTIEARDFANKNLRGLSVEKPRVRGTAMRLLGTIAGGTHGPLGILAGHGMGGLLADIVTNTQLGSSFKMSLIRDLTDHPEMIKQAQELLAQVEKMQPPLLGPGKGIAPTKIPSGPTMYSGRGGVSTNMEDAAHGNGPARQDIEDEIAAAHDYHSQYEPYTPNEKLPTIDFGKGKKPSGGSSLPTIR